MLKRLFLIITLACATAFPALAQNANSSTSTRQRTSGAAAQKPPAKGVEEAGAPQTEPKPTPTPRTSAGGRRSRAQEPSSKDVMAAFNSIIAGIRNANVAAVTSGYWNSPQLILFNYNGTVTRGWEQMRTNRESSYPNLKDVTLDVKDPRVQMLGADGAVVTCLWTQSQTYRGTPETATGRMTLVFRRIGGAWKAVHLHTSPDSPDPSRVPQSEQTTTTTTPTPAPTPKVRP